MSSTRDLVKPGTDCWVRWPLNHCLSTTQPSTTPHPYTSICVHLYYLTQMSLTRLMSTYPWWQQVPTFASAQPFPIVIIFIFLSLAKRPAHLHIFYLWQISPAHLYTFYLWQSGLRIFILFIFGKAARASLYILSLVKRSFHSSNIQSSIIMILQVLTFWVGLTQITSTSTIHLKILEIQFFRWCRTPKKSGFEWLCWVRNLKEATSSHFKFFKRYKIPLPVLNADRFLMPVQRLGICVSGLNTLQEC